MSDDKRYDGDPSTPVFDRATEGQPQRGAASGHDHLRRDDAVTDLGDQVGAYADITDPGATATDFSATAAPVVEEHPAHDATGSDTGSGGAPDTLEPIFFLGKTKGMHTYRVNTKQYFEYFSNNQIINIFKKNKPN